MKAFSAFRRLNEEPDLPTLLSIRDKRLVTLTEEEAEELLMSQPVHQSDVTESMESSKNCKN